MFIFLLFFLFFLFPAVFFPACTANQAQRTLASARSSSSSSPGYEICVQTDSSSSPVGKTIIIICISVSRRHYPHPDSDSCSDFLLLASFLRLQSCLSPDPLAADVCAYVSLHLTPFPAPLIHSCRSHDYNKQRMARRLPGDDKEGYAGASSKQRQERHMDIVS